MRVLLFTLLICCLPAFAEPSAVRGVRGYPKAQLITGAVMFTLGAGAGIAGLAYQPCRMSFFGGCHDWLGSGLAKYSAMIGGASMALAGLITMAVALINLARAPAELPPEPELRFVPPPSKLPVAPLLFSQAISL